jgi:uncharacterized protein
MTATDRTDAGPSSAGPDGLTDDEFHARLSAFVGQVTGPPMPAPDEVNLAMVRHWCEAMGDTNPVYLDAAAAAASAHGGLVAPPTMLQAWVMHGLTGPERDGDGPYDQLTELLATRGFTSVVATNCDQTYDRYLRPGDRLSMVTTITAVSPQKDTALGTGHFVTTRQDYLDANGERVGSMEFRIIRFRPRATAVPTTNADAGESGDTSDAPPRPRPATTRDTGWWFDALSGGDIRVQRCAACGLLRHPPAPMCPRCHGLGFDDVGITGTGTIHSFTVVHYPQVPGFTYPLAVVLVDVDVDGEAVRPVRMVMNTRDTDLSAVVVGAPVRIEVHEDGGQRLPFAIVDRHGADAGAGAATTTDEASPGAGPGAR